MSFTDPIADMLTRIRNAVSAKHDSVTIPCSKEKLEIAKNLLKEKVDSSIISKTTGLTINQIKSIAL